ncbi:MAG TPA: hypothetical protein VKC61_07830 [Pyrinomonadaceae bacterium]|nr:hypothetical protein [Pyrinomonadaceae bacterium]
MKSLIEQQLDRSPKMIELTTFTRDPHRPTQIAINATKNIPTTRTFPDRKVYCS